MINMKRDVWDMFGFDYGISIYDSVRGASSSFFFSLVE